MSLKRISCVEESAVSSFINSYRLQHAVWSEHWKQCLNNASMLHICGMCAFIVF